MKSLSALPKEIAGGIALLLAGCAALVMVNTGGVSLYNDLMHMPVALGKDFHHMVNDGLMALFFVLVGIEIRRERAVGELRDPRHALLPVAAAVGGFFIPAAIFVAFNHADEVALRGWAIPAATDIAFAVALVMALKAHVPKSLQVFLLALAVMDDLLAILVIAVFFTHELAWINLALAGCCAMGLSLMSLSGVRRALPYVFVGLVMWFLVMESGVHATLAGVLTGLLLPRADDINAVQSRRGVVPVRDGGGAELLHVVRRWDFFKNGVHVRLVEVLTGLLPGQQAGLLEHHGDDKEHQPALPRWKDDGNRSTAAAERVEHALEGWVRWVVLPVFAFANLGLVFKGVGMDVLTHTKVVGITAGLVIGKPLGVVAMVWLMKVLGLAGLPAGANWRQVWGIGCLCGIGFTMSLFIGLLAFSGERELMTQVQVGVLIGSLVSALLAVAVLVSGRKN